jgi:hypothetical protein
MLDAGVALSHIQGAVDRTSASHATPAESASLPQNEGISLSNHAAQHGKQSSQIFANQDHEGERVFSAAEQEGQQIIGANDAFDTAQMLANHLHEQFRLLWAEVTRFNPTFASKPYVIIVNKADLFEGSTRDAFQAALSRLKSQLAQETLSDCNSLRGKSCDVLVTSAVLGWGLDEVEQKLQMLMSLHTSKEEAPEQVALKASGC